MKRSKAMGLDHQTEQRMRELFGGRHCCQCNAPAARLMDDRYYCHGHFLAARRGHRRKPRGPASAQTAVSRLLAGEARADGELRCLDTIASPPQGAGPDPAPVEGR
jgi:hypothetical protein